MFFSTKIHREGEKICTKRNLIFFSFFQAGKWHHFSVISDYVLGGGEFHLVFHLDKKGNLVLNLTFFHKKLE